MTHTGNKQNEIFLFNTNLEKFPSKVLERYKTIRFGDIALSISGKSLKDTYPKMRPVFINKSEQSKTHQSNEEFYKLWNKWDYSTNKLI